MTISIAFFLSDKGDLIQVPDNHISIVIADPERFGLTREKIEAAYRRHEEKVGVEGAARLEILLHLVSQGWIRIRRYRNYWSVTAPSLTPAIQQRLQSWAFKMLSGVNGFREPDRFMPVRISTPEGHHHRTIKDLAEGCHSAPRDDHEVLREPALAFRTAIERCKDSLRFSVMKRFPVGCCKLASLLLGRYLVQELGYRPVRFVSGEDHHRLPQPCTHIWLEYAGILIDITADQFRERTERVIITDDRSWHDKTFPEQKSFDLETEERGFESSYRAKLDADYSCILGVLSCPTIDQGCSR